MHIRTAAARRRVPPRALGVIALVAVCLAPLTPAVAAPPGPHTDTAADLRQKLEALVRAPGGPPGVIAVLRDGDRTKVVRAGVAELGTDRAPQIDDHMRIASAAKAFSGAVALSLVNMGDLRLDDTIGSRLPRLPRAWHAVTLRQLLHHTSGLPDYTQSPEFAEIVRADPRHRFDSRRLLDFVSGEPPAFRPGSRYQYSNSDNIAVALMAEAVTRTPYERLLDELVYRHLGLRGTSLPQGYRMPEPYLHGYDVSPPEPPEDVSEALSMSGVWASGGIVSTPGDLTRFIRGYTGGALYDDRVVREQRRWVDGSSQPAGPGRNSAGLGIFRYATRCGTVLGHTGNMPGYTQLMAATPDGRRSLTFSSTTQINETLKPELLREMRAVQEDFVCALLRGKG
ncbi:serine hydrolase domain-containing protein [Streptomyces broussonetiae]|uniref:Serine hydrolase domain-containing protein n=1 Tax=Streptomyces broussonetiae TaxID=2686304 RepID=A0ABV5EHS6_9ACTN